VLFLFQFKTLPLLTVTAACDNRAEPCPAERLERIMPDLPSSTVTFLFTDIEGSTVLWEQDRTGMATAVERHLVLLWAATEAHNGVLRTYPVD